jgi:hypothetical protein
VIDAIVFAIAENKIKHGDICANCSFRTHTFIFNGETFTNLCSTRDCLLDELYRCLEEYNGFKVPKHLQGELTFEEAKYMSLFKHKCNEETEEML